MECYQSEFQWIQNKKTAFFFINPHPKAVSRRRTWYGERKIVVGRRSGGEPLTNLTLDRRTASSSKTGVSAHICTRSMFPSHPSLGGQLHCAALVGLLQTHPSHRSQAPGPRVKAPHQDTKAQCNHVRTNPEAHHRLKQTRQDLKGTLCSMV